MSKIKPPLGLGLNDYLVLVGFVFLTFKGYASFFSDPGIGWHLKLGEMIAKHQIWPNSDPRVFSAEHSHWILDQWLGDLVLYTLSSYNLAVLYVVFGCLLVWLSYRLLYSNLQKITGTFILSSLVCVYVNSFIGIHFLARPVFLSFILFASFYFYLNSVEIRRNLRSKNLLMIFILSVLWANIHSSFLLIWFLVGVKFLVDVCVNKPRERFSSILRGYIYLVLIVLNRYPLNP